MRRKRTADRVRTLARVEYAILGLLLRPGGPGGPWSLREIARETGDRQDVVETAVGGLRAAGLAHRVDAFVFASRAAAHFHDLGLQWTR